MPLADLEIAGGAIGELGVGFATIPGLAWIPPPAHETTVRFFTNTVALRRRVSCLAWTEIPAERINAILTGFVCARRREDGKFLPSGRTSPRDRPDRGDRPGRGTRRPSVARAGQFAPASPSDQAYDRAMALPAALSRRASRGAHAHAHQPEAAGPTFTHGSLEICVG